MFRQARQVFAEHPNFAFAGATQANDAAQQHGFTAARATHHRQDLALVQIQVEVLVHALAAKTVAQATHFNHRLSGRTV